MAEHAGHGLLLAGFAAGTFFTGLALSALKVSPLTIFVPPGDISTLVAGFGGAALGGIVSWVIAADANAKSRRREQDIARENEKSVALKTNVKLSNINNRLHSLMSAMSEQLEESFAKDQNPPQSALWQRLYPLVGISFNRIDFDVDELSLAFKMENETMANDLIKISERYAALMDSVHLYFAERAKIKEMIPMHVQDRMAITVISREHYISLTPQFQVLSDLSVQICEGLLEDFTEANRIISLYYREMKRYFSSKKEHPVFDPTPHVLRFRELVERAVAVQGNGFKVGENDPAEGFDLWKPQSGFFSYTLADDNK